jgi:integrase/recombinase XerD
MKRNRRLILMYQIFSDTLEDYLSITEFSELSPLTISSKRITITSLMNYLGDNGVLKICNCKQRDVTGYLVSVSHLASSTLSGRRFILRHFFNYLNKANITSFSGNEIFPVIFTNKRERILSFYSAHEIKNVIRTVDRTTKFGKRDFVVILLVAELGIRSGDIIRLKLSNINWERNTIEFVQHKTKVFNQLPLLNNIRYALIDYLKNSRPKSDSTSIILGVKNELMPITNTCIHQTVSKYFKKANIDISTRKHGPHAMRHSLANNLLYNNTPIHVIKDVLGHLNLNTTKMYLNIDVSTLRMVALEVPHEES